MPQQTILIVGSLNMDQIVQVTRLPMMGETLIGASSLQLIPGGKGANQAIAMARLGASVSMAGRVGRDPFGAQLLKALWADKVATTLIAIDEQEASGVALIFLMTTGENAIVVASGANMCVGKDQIHMNEIISALPDARALVLQQEIPMKTVETLISMAYRMGVPVVLNLSPAQPLSLEILRQVKVLVVNETEASFLRDALSNTDANAPVVQTVEEARALAAKLHELGIPNVIITLGSQGAILACTDEAGETASFYQKPPKVVVVDTTGAGDCFAGAFTVGLTEGQPPAEALRFAVYASALNVTKFGAQSGLPTRTEVEALLRTA